VNDLIKERLASGTSPTAIPTGTATGTGIPAVITTTPVVGITIARVEHAALLVPLWFYEPNRQARTSQKLMWRILCIFALLIVPIHAADVCAAGDLKGPYGFQLSGTSTISGAPAPVAGLARLEFDGRADVTGYSSVNFNGLLLGNPVTGTYEVSSDCKLSWRLQDDSGGFQHFSGVIKPGVNRIEVRQTDRGAGPRGVLEKTSDACQAVDFRERYTFTFSGTSTTLATGGAPITVSAKGVIEADGNGNFTLTENGKRNAATVEIDSDCVVHIEFARPNAQGDDSEKVKLRGILVDGGKGVLAIQIDPGESVAARFTAQ
jgi:hypothetical protein